MAKESEHRDDRSRASDPGQALTGAALDQFLHLDIVARLACLDAGGWPYNVPVWHEWDGSGFWVIAAEGAAWARFLLADPRVAVCIDEPATLRRVLCQGTALLEEEATERGRWNPIARRMAGRYLGEEAIVDYEATSAGLRRILFRIQPLRLVGWHGAGRSEHSPTRPPATG